MIIGSDTPFSFPLFHYLSFANPFGVIARLLFEKPKTPLTTIFIDMAIEIVIPNLGENVESGDVLEVMVSEGDRIEKDQGVLELETDKATVIVPATAAGTVSKIHCKEGETVSVGAVVITVEAADSSGSNSEPAKMEASDSKSDEASKPSQPTPAPADSSAPPSTSTSTSRSTADVVENDASGKSEPAPTSNASTEVSANRSGTSDAADRSSTTTGSSVSDGSASSSNPSAATQTAATQTVAADSLGTSSIPASQIPAGPAIRRFAREVGVDLALVQGTGENGRITRHDVLLVVRSGAVATAGSQATANKTKAGDRDDHGPVHIEKMPKIRQTIARKMHESWTTCPRVTNFDDADVTELEKIRQNSKKEYGDKGIKLTSMPFLIKAVAMSLKAHPVINASVDLEAGQVIYKDYINIGIAVDTDRGLVVPVLRNADQLSIPEIARQLGEMAAKVRDNEFSIDQLRGGTFTISNLGAIGGTYSTPIINTPETAILLAGKSRKLPVVMDGDQIAVRLMTPLSLSYDHRLIDGGAAARFLNEVISYLEAPSRLLLAL